MVRIVISLLLLFFTSYIGMTQAEIYKWIDKSGQVHYSQRAPVDRDATEIESKVGAPAAEEAQRAHQRIEMLLEEQRRHREERLEAARHAAREKAARERIKEMRRDLCLRAQNNLWNLLQGRPVFRIDEKGERIFLADADWAAEIERQKAAIKAYCD